MTLSELRQAVGAGSRMTVSIAVRRFRQRLEREKPLRKSLRGWASKCGIVQIRNQCLMEMANVTHI